MPHMADDHTTTTVTNRAGKETSKSIQGRALDPSGELAVQERMRTTDLGALARAAQAKKATGTSKETQKKALSAEDKKEK